MRYKYYKKRSRFGLAWSRSRADRGVSRPTGVFRTTISVCKILSRSVEIWQYEGQKPVLESKQSTIKPIVRLGRQLHVETNNNCKYNYN